MLSINGAGTNTTAVSQIIKSKLRVCLIYDDLIAKLELSYTLHPSTICPWVWKVGQASPKSHTNHPLRGQNGCSTPHN